MNRATEEILRQIRILMQPQDFASAERNPPTSDVISTTLKCVLTAGEQMAENMPRGTVDADYDGGIRIEWHRPERTVVYIASRYTPAPSVIHTGTGSYGAEEATPEHLVDWLRWLIQDGSAMNQSMPQVQ